MGCETINQSPDAKDRRGTIKDNLGIDQRPDFVDEHIRVGDIEVLLMDGKEADTKQLLYFFSLILKANCFN